MRDLADVAPDAEFSRHVVINNRYSPQSIRVGAKTLFMGEASLMAPDARVSLGDFCFVGPGAKLWSMKSIEVGNNVQISHGVMIADNGASAYDARKPPAEVTNMPDPIIIEDDVWIGFNAVILKGAKIGRGAIIGACSVIASNVEPFSIMVGNPARKVGEGTP